jgi:hypothetical protein
VVVEDSISRDQTITVGWAGVGYLGSGFIAFDLGILDVQSALASAGLGADALDAATFFDIVQPRIFLFDDQSRTADFSDSVGCMRSGLCATLHAFSVYFEAKSFEEWFPMLWDYDVTTMVAVFYPENHE